MAFDHAVVVGAGIGGLLSAAALAPRFDRVTILERDELPADATHRRGVPQGEQMHVLLAIGQDAIEELLPGIGAAWADAGAAWFDSTRDVASFSSQGWTARGPSEAWTYGLRRLVLERTVRDRIRGIPNVTIEQETVTGLRASRDGMRVTAVELRGDSAIEADLIVDASGRTSHAREWIAALGFEPPVAHEIVSDIVYSTALVRLRDDALRADIRGVLAPPTPISPRGAVLLPCGDGLHQIVAVAQNASRAPAGRDEFLAELDEAPTPVIADAARRAEFVDDPKPFKIRGTRRTRWEDMASRPDGFVAVGDAVLALNPIYGQGMSVAAVEALTMRDLVASADAADPAGLARRIQEAFRSTLDFVFDSGLRSDARFSATTLHGVEAPPPPKSRVLGALATEDWKVAVALRYVSHYFSAAPVQRPEIRARIRAWSSSGRRPRNPDPAVVPKPFDGQPLPR
ncbi:FAD-dependent monooxygenase [Microbacterium sp. CFH 90308]|uniref:FAD-dependent monooxygenase n=1 Tax=Microbacterium salsuginis TaxID=2722803 RepID=A0ABX1KFA2_9MICO|nr:FAD-dependent monooxygenase [Microbacterium sp. CFH 90308]NLP85030.1 FAD-dependent monooxygenase [Microbacterium sp. CFH 90308]